MSCRTYTVESWLAEGCPAKADLPQTFADFYSNTTGIYLPENGATSETLNFQYMLADICNQSDKGGTCAPLWQTRCQGYTRQDTQNPLIGYFCGCYLPESEYNITGPDERACDPICAINKINGVNYFTPAGNSVSCNTNICLINDVTVNAVGSNVGSITFSQLCDVCDTPGSCRCIISDINILAQDSRLSNTQIIQNCGTATECFQRNPDGTIQQVDCKQYQQAFTRGRSGQRRVEIALLLLLLLLLFLLLAWLVRANDKSQKKNENKN